MRKMVIRQGYVKFWRLGTVEFADQSRWSERAPRSRGMWAFPYPFYDSYLTFHKYSDLMPKHLQAEGALWEDQEKWLNTIGKKVLPIREFWYKGDVFTHFMPNGDIGGTGIFMDYGTDWTVMDATKMAKHVASSGGDSVMQRTDRGLSKFRSSIDHLEVFIAPGMGKIREGNLTTLR